MLKRLNDFHFYLLNEPYDSQSLFKTIKIKKNNKFNNIVEKD